MFFHYFYLFSVAFYIFNKCFIEDIIGKSVKHGAKWVKICFSTLSFFSSATLGKCMSIGVCVGVGVGVGVMYPHTWKRFISLVGGTSEGWCQNHNCDAMDTFRLAIHQASSWKGRLEVVPKFYISRPSFKELNSRKIRFLMGKQSPLKYIC